MPRNTVLTVFAGLAYAGAVVVFATEKLTHREVPFGDVWKIALVTITVVCMLCRSSKDPD